jgi:hypothetical protein
MEAHCSLLSLVGTTIMVTMVGCDWKWLTDLT